MTKQQSFTVIQARVWRDWLIDKIYALRFYAAEKLYSEMTRYGLAKSKGMSTGVASFEWRASNKFSSPSLGTISGLPEASVTSVRYSCFPRTLLSGASEGLFTAR